MFSGALHGLPAWQFERPNQGEPMNQDTQDFLGTLLWTAHNPDDPKTAHIANWTIWEFHPDFVAAVDRFIAGFREYLEKLDEQATDTDVYAHPDNCERSFGGNVYLSLSGHGCGFFDDRDMELGDALQAAVEAYAGGDRHRFEELDGNLSKFHGKIHLGFRTAAYRKTYLEQYFGVPAERAA